MKTVLLVIFLTGVGPAISNTHESYSVDQGLYATVAECDQVLQEKLQEAIHFFGMVVWGGARNVYGYARCINFMAYVGEPV